MCLQRSLHIRSNFLYQFFVSNVLAQVLRGASSSYRKGKLKMQNFDEEYPHVIENVGCRCKICEGSIFKSQIRQDADAIVHDG